MPNYRSLSDKEVATEADRYADIVPRELVTEMIYRLRRQSNQTSEPSGARGERVGDVTYTGRLPHVRK